MNRRAGTKVVQRAHKAVYFPTVLNSSGARALRLEGYGPEGVAVLLECVTADAEGLRALLRRTFRRYGGYLGAQGSVSYLFDRVGRLHFDPQVDRGPLTRAALEAGAEEVIGEPQRGWNVLTDPRDIDAVRAALARGGWVARQADVIERAPLTVTLCGEAARQVEGFLAALAEVEGVRSVYSNVEISDALVARV